MLVAKMPLFPEHPQLGADGRVAGGIRQANSHLGDACLPTLMDDVHDLAFAQGEMGGSGH